MRVMALTRTGAGALEAAEREDPIALPGEIVIRVRACGVCRTDLHIVDGELPPPDLPLVPGHEIVGVVEQIGDSVSGFSVGDRVGVPWLAYTCGECRYCTSGRENLCRGARFTGYHIDGGYADITASDARYAIKLSDKYSDVDVAPLLCAGLIGYRSYRMAGDPARLGLYGFGAAAHLIAQLAVHDGRTVFAFTPPGKTATQEFARSLGAAWAGDSGTPPPEPLDAAIIFAPVGTLVTEALSHLGPGGTVVCAGIHMSDIPGFPYQQIWEERSIRSVANLTRQDAREFLDVAERAGITAMTTKYDLAAANTALGDVRAGRIRGAAVLVPGA